MNSIDDRGQAMENKFAHDEKLSFEAEAKGSKIFGLWMAEQLGLEGADAETYAKTVVAANLDEPGFDDIVRKVRIDIDAKGLDISDHVINTEIEKAMSEAQKIIASE